MFFTVFHNLKGGGFYTVNFTNFLESQTFLTDTRNFINLNRTREI